MASYRNDMIAQEIKRALDKLIRETLDDPRIQGTYSITRADVARDLSHAKIYVSVLEDEYANELISALKSAAGFLRKELGRQVQIRFVPQLSFVLDKNIEYGIHIAEKLKEVLAEEGVKDDEEDSE